MARISRNKLREPRTCKTVPWTPLRLAVLAVFTATMVATHLGGLASAGAIEQVTVTFRVHVPAETPENAKLYLSGNIKELGDWHPPAGLALVRSKHAIWQGSVSVPKGSRIEYKLTRGNWATVEKGKDGREIANRQLVADHDITVEVTVVTWSADSAPNSAHARPSSVTGEVRYHQDITSQYLSGSRTIAVYLPPGYGERAVARFPVFYLQDGQNLFDAATSAFGAEWQADEAAERLIRSGKIRPVILVGIYNTVRRTTEYTPTLTPTSRNQGDRYARFLVEEVKPMIDRTYRTQTTRKYTAVGGSSLGGVISLRICERYPDTFSMCAAISPAFGWRNGDYMKHMSENHGWFKRIRFWVQMGTLEGANPDSWKQNLDGARGLTELMREEGLNYGQDYRYLEVTGGQHNEDTWAQEFDKVLLFFFGKP